MRTAPRSRKSREAKWKPARTGIEDDGCGKAPEGVSRLSSMLSGRGRWRSLSEISRGEVVNAVIVRSDPSVELSEIGLPRDEARTDYPKHSAPDLSLDSIRTCFNCALIMQIEDLSDMDRFGKGNVGRMCPSERTEVDVLAAGRVSVSPSSRVSTPLTTTCYRHRRQLN